MGAELSLSTELLQTVNAQLSPGHRLDLVENGRVFDVLEQLFEQARSTIHIALYMWFPGQAADRVVAALCAAAARGVTVRVVLDAVGTRETRSDLGRLARPGCELRIYRKPFHTSLRKTLSRSHRKIVVVDGTRGLIGGFGVRDVWLGDGLSPDSWRDTALRVQGPAVRQMQVAFAEVWRGASGAPLPEACFPELGPVGESAAAFVSSRATVGRSEARLLMKMLLHRARRRAWLATGYAVPPRGLREDMFGACARGVDLRILAPGEHNDVRVARLAQRSLYRTLRNHGVRVFEYEPSMLHRKVALIDDDVVVVGSINLDTLSMRHSQEGSLIALDRALADQVEQSFRTDFARSVEVEHPRRGLLPIARAAHRVVHPRLRD